MKNCRVILSSRPRGVPQAENYQIEEVDLDPLPEGQVLIRNNFLSIDPAMRGWVGDEGNYSSQVTLGSVMRSLAVGEVIESRHPDYSSGDVVTGWFGWQEYAAVDADAITRRVQETDLPRSLSLGILGINGVTAFIALTQIGKPNAGDTLLVSTAAGSVGSAVGQIGKLLGCRTVGITGGAEKAELCKRLFAYDAAIDYRVMDLGAAVEAACPSGVNIYFDNTAGVISDAVYPRLAVGARVVICGTSSIPSWNPWPSGPRVERHLLVKRASAQGFLALDHTDQWENAIGTLADWIRDGRLNYQEHVLQGLEAAPDSIACLYRSENMGKLLVSV